MLRVVLTKTRLLKHDFPVHGLIKGVWVVRVVFPVDDFGVFGARVSGPCDRALSAPSDSLDA